MIPGGHFKHKTTFFHYSIDPIQILHGTKLVWLAMGLKVVVEVFQEFIPEFQLTWIGLEEIWNLE